MHRDKRMLDLLKEYSIFFVWITLEIDVGKRGEDVLKMVGKMLQIVFSMHWLVLAALCSLCLLSLWACK